ncbi:MAG: AAA family ATPase [Gammaproteobacteria bacterium]|nr:AAA family ATPase [Gammaproteobacteria bacterium]
MSQDSTQCHQCGGDNRSEANFCAHCGGKLLSTCGQCGKRLSLDAKFCDGCGANLIPSGNGRPPSQSATDKLPPELPAASAERRHLTVVFVDLVGSAEMSAILDPEEMRELLAAYQDSCADVVTRFDGYIARYVGDGILIYFGYPTAHEDDAARAVGAGLAITKAVDDLRFNFRSKAIDPRVRIGAASGLVVVGDIGSGARREEMAVVGETPNLASRLQGLAGPGEMIISETTRKLIGGMFELEALDEATLKGIPGAMQCHRVIGEGSARTRLETVADSALTPFVGRAEELLLLENRWRQAKEGELRLVCVSGEAGIGKSRLIKSLRDSIKREPNHRLLYFGSPYHQNSAFAPIIDQLRRAFGFVHTDTDHDRINKLKKTLGELGLTTDEIIEPVQTLLSISIDGRLRADTDPSETRTKIVQALLTVVEALCDRSPVFMLAEDAHWFDPSSLDFIANLTQRLAEKQLLLIVTHRPEFSPPVAGGTHVTELPLSRMSRGECIEIMDRVTHGKSLPESIRGEVIGKTDGIPLFVEELTKTVLETGVVENREGKFVSIEPRPSLAIPDSLRDSLMARLDRLATVRDVAQLAATLRRTFSLELLDAVSTLESEALNNALTRLIESGLIYERSRPPDTTYEFKHALVRDAAYESLLKSTRQKFHHRIARTIEERFPDLAEREPELLAQHYTESGLTEQAIRYWLQAGQQAWWRSAVLEAIADTERGLSLLPELADEQLAKTLEIDLLLVLGSAIKYSHGPASQRAYDIYQRARR